MFFGSRMSWTNEALTNVFSFTMCAKISRIFAVNSFFADSFIRKRTTRVILSDILSPLSGAQDRVIANFGFPLVLRPPLSWIKECVECLNLAGLRDNHVEACDGRLFPFGAEAPCQPSCSVVGVGHTPNSLKT